MYDVQKIETDNPLPTVAERYIPDLKADGKEFHAPCPFHDEKDPSFTIYQKRGEWRFHCFGCGATGDTIGFVQDIESVDFKAACEILGGEREPSRKAAKRRKAIVVPDVYEGYTPLPIPEGETLEAGRHFKAWNPKRADDPKRKVANYKPSMVFPYRDDSGVLIGYVIRVDTIGGRKLTPTIRWVERPDGQVGWCHYGFDTPRPLYGSDRLNIPDKQVLIVEGEKAADAGQRLMEMPTISWHGGTNAVDKADWSKLAGRKVVIMGDADAPGEKAAGVIAAILAPIAAQVKVVGWDKEKPKGWDIADAEHEGLTKNHMLAWIKQRVTVVAKPAEVPASEQHPPVDGYDGHEPEDVESDEEFEKNLMFFTGTVGGKESDEQATPADTITTNGAPADTPPANKAPFKILGYDQNRFSYFPEGMQQIVTYMPSQHTPANLLAMAPLEYWAEAFPGKHQPDWLAAQNALLNRAMRQGVFNGKEAIRGRGAWKDNDEVIVHTGPHILVNGSMINPSDYESRYVYEKASHLDITKTDPLSNKQANELVKIIDRLTWEDPLSGALLAGWCVIAPVCGILDWRPHIWLTGQKGSGKTTVLKDVVKRIIGKVGLYVEGDSTEAGIRQTLNRDARPIVMDEAESETKKDSARMEAVLKFARKASSGGDIIKGTSSGEPIIYKARSVFCFSSINTSIHHDADHSRITKLVIVQNRAPDRKEHYKKLIRDIRETFTTEYSSRMFSRTMKYVDILQANCETFIDAVDETLGDRRAGDQAGPMLAGYYLLHKTDLISKERAIEFIETHDWNEHTALGGASDATYCLELLTSHKERVFIVEEKRERMFTVGDLIVQAASRTLTGFDASEALKSIGIIVDHKAQTFTIANKSAPLDDIYSGSPWATGDARKRQFKSIDGAVPTDNVKYFSPAIGRSRGVVLPVGLLEEGA